MVGNIHLLESRQIRGAGWATGGGNPIGDLGVAWFLASVVTHQLCPTRQVPMASKPRVSESACFRSVPLNFVTVKRSKP